MVNISDNGFFFVRASIVAELSDNRVIREIENRNPQIRDIIITTLRSQKKQELTTPEPEILKNQIITKLNKILKTGRISNIWFTQLVIQ